MHTAQRAYCSADMVIEVTQNIKLKNIIIVQFVSTLTLFLLKKTQKQFKLYIFFLLPVKAKAI